MTCATFTGYGKAMMTGAATVNMFGVAAREIAENSKRCKGFTIDAKKLKKAIEQVAKGDLSLDEISWIWNPGNYIVTQEREIYYFMHS